VLQAQLDALEAVEVGGTACTLGTEVNAVKRVEVIPLPDAKDMRSAGPPLDRADVLGNCSARYAQSAFKYLYFRL
jgi:hypothetical protein